MRGLNPRQIEAFRAVVLTGGVGMAAKLINVTQPAVSRMIRDLQQQLGLTLFERRGTGLVPTSEALSLYAEVERAFVGLERIAQMADELRTRRAGFLRIAALPAWPTVSCRASPEGTWSSAPSSTSSCRGWCRTPS